MKLFNKILLTLFCVLVIGFTIFSFVLRANYVVPVLMYHSIEDAPKSNRLAVPPESFERQMKFLRDHDYNVISLNELASFLGKHQPVPPRTVCITFDDGYENNYTQAFPILEKYDLSATIFVVADWAGKEGYASWGQVKEMSEGVIDIGSHTVSHATLTKLDKVELKKELVNSKSILEARLKKDVSFLAYPAGAFNPDVRQAAINAGYQGACATNPGGKYPDNDLYALKRLRISRTSDDLFVFWLEISGLYTFIKEVRDDD